MNVLLIWPYNPHGIEIPELFPLGLGYLLSNIDPKRHHVQIIDCTLDALSPESSDFEKKILDFNPDVIGISFWSSNADSIYSTCKTIRSILPKAKIVFGGPHATAYGVYEIEKNHADYVISGESETAFPMLLDALETQDYEKQRHIPGLIYQDDNKTVRSNPVCFEPNLDRLGNVDYGMLRLSRYHQAGYGYSGQAVLHENLPSALIVATRGCPYRCKFCSAPLISGRKIRTHSPGYIAKTIQMLYDDFQVRVISLGDDNFTINESYAVDLCKAIIDLKLDDLILTSPNGFRLTSLSKKLAKLLRKAGWEEVTIAPESGSPWTLALMQKDMNLEDVAPFVRMCHEVGLKVKANFIIGFPGETVEDVLLTERFIQANQFDQIGLSFFQPLPGTPIFEELVSNGEIDRSFVPARFNQLTYCPDQIGKEELCNSFNRIKNEFRDSKGWKYKNANVGTIRD